MTLSELRERHGLSVREVARRMKTSHPIVLNFEKRGIATLKTAESYAVAIEEPFDVVHQASIETRQAALTVIAA